MNHFSFFSLTCKHIHAVISIACCKSVGSREANPFEIEASFVDGDSSKQLIRALGMEAREKTRGPIARAFCPRW